MKQTGPVPVVDLAPTIRLGRLTTIAASLALILSASASSASSNSFAPPVNASRAPAPGATAYGNDISWPQCPKDGGGNGLPGPMTSASFAVLGLTDGGSFRANPCLARQVASVKTRHLWAGAYAISTYPTNAELAPRRHWNDDPAATSGRRCAGRLQSRHHGQSRSAITDGLGRCRAPDAIAVVDQRRQQQRRHRRRHRALPGSGRTRGHLLLQQSLEGDHRRPSPAGSAHLGARRPPDGGG